MQLRNSLFRKEKNQQFLSQKNLAMKRLISEIDCPEEELLSSNPTPPLMMQQPQQQRQPQDSLTCLLQKAQNAVRSTSLKRTQSKHLRKTGREVKEGKQQNQAFLTGVFLNEVEEKEEDSMNNSQMLDQEIMKLLQKKTLDDQLEELKRQIRQTNGHLKSYSRQVMGTQKSVYQLAGRYNSYFNLKIPISSPTVDFSGLSYHQLKNPKTFMSKPRP